MHLNDPPEMSPYDWRTRCTLPPHHYMHTSSSIISPSGTMCTSCGLVLLRPQMEERHSRRRRRDIALRCPHKSPPYLTMRGHRNPMSLLWHRSKSHQYIPTHMRYVLGLCLLISSRRRRSMPSNYFKLLWHEGRDFGFELALQLTPVVA